MSDITNNQIQEQNQNIYKDAVRKKLRFETSHQGVINVEDLWTLNLVSNRSNEVTLDVIATALANKLSQQKVTSVVNPEKESEGTKLDKLRLAIIMDVIATRKEEYDARKIEEKRRMEIDKLLGLIADKQDKQLGERSIEELQAELVKLTSKV